jgi:hypothetical protein
MYQQPFSQRETIMTYHTPELLLVGAAQNFVLGASDRKNICPDQANLDFPAGPEYTENGVDGASW